MKKEYSIIETFVGCGGSHFGFKKAGFKPLFVNDIWNDALQTLKINDKDIDENIIINDDIININEKFLQDKNINYSDLDVLIGGVVCKGFSLAGIRNPLDERNYLYLQQLRLVKFLQPKISIIENVPGMLNMKILQKNNNEEVSKLCIELDNTCNEFKKIRGKLISDNKKNSENSEDIKKELEKLQNKRKKLEKDLEIYKYSVIEDIKKIYNEMNYDVYTKVLCCSDYECATSRKRLFIVAIRKDLNIKWKYPEPITKNNKISVKEAFKLIDYENINNPLNDIDNKPMNHTDKTIEKFKNIKSDVKTNTGYFSRGTSSRLSYDKPAPTLVPGHSAFQIHPIENRSITIREGAILTGFNNTFKFYGSHSSKCIQIGNAIPVNMAYHLANQCKNILEIL